jgi:Ca2+-transporting ATPase
VICTDKTGTLTRNEMTVTKLFVNDIVIDVTGTGYGISGRFMVSGEVIDPSSFKLLLRIGALNNDAALSEQGRVIGDPTEAYLLVSAAKAGLESSILKEGFPRIHEIPFDSGRKRKSTVHRDNGELVMYTKGAPDVVLTCSSRIDTGGTVSRLTGQNKDRYHQRHGYDYCCYFPAHGSGGPLSLSPRPPPGGRSGAYGCLHLYRDA